MERWKGKAGQGDITAQAQWNGWTAAESPKTGKATYTVGNPFSKEKRKSKWHVPRANLTCGELALQLLEDRVLGCGLCPAGQRLRGCAGEHGRDVGHILQAYPESAHQLLDKVKSVRGDLGI